MVLLSPLNILDKTQRVLAIQDVQSRREKIASLDWFFELGRAFPVELVGQASVLLLAAALQEADQQVKTEMLAVLLTAVSWNEVSAYIAWDELIAHLPLLAGPLLISALEMLGWSRRTSDLVVLRSYLDSVADDTAQMNILDAMGQIWWDKSGRDPALQEALLATTRQYLWFLLLNPTQHALTEKAVHTQVQLFRHEFVANVSTWFDQYTAVKLW